MTAELLGDLLIEARSGFAFGGDDPDGIFQFRMNNITRDSQLDLTKRRRVSREAHRQMSEFVLTPGDVLFNATNSFDMVGKSALIGELDEPAVFSNHFFRLRADRNHLDPAYLAHWLRFRFAQGAFQSMCKQWVNQATVSRERLLAMRIPLPPLDEQRRIAKILDRADALLGKQELATIAVGTAEGVLLASALEGKSLDLAPLGDLIDADDRLNYGVVQPGPEDPDGVPMIRVSDLRSGMVDRSALKRVSPDVDRTHWRSRLRGSEILLTCVGSAGGVALVRDQDVGSNIARAITRIPITDVVTRNYVAAVLKSPRLQRYFKDELRTVSQPTLNVKQIALAPIPILSRAEIVAFVQKQSLLNATLTKMLSSQTIIQSMRKSLQARAFSGQL